MQVNNVVTPRFDKLFKEMMSVDVLGPASSQPYDTSDVRTPEILGVRKRKKSKK
jgi:hypothetical protein